MTIRFSKYQGTGNDFILIDSREDTLNLERRIIKHLCDRNFGIGADGLMLLERDNENDFYMRYFNADGLESTMCGNGGRCIVKFAQRLGLVHDDVCFMGSDGVHIAKISDDIVNIKMRNVEEIDIDEDYYLLDTGSPHYVHFVENIDRVNVETEGRFIRNSFNPDGGGVNVNFVQVLSEEEIRIRTYERGVERETLACGTGAVASAIATNHWLDYNQEVCSVYTPGGVLRVSFERSGEQQYQNIWLVGPAVHVFDGIVEV